MIRIRNQATALAALVLLASCSNDDPADRPDASEPGAGATASATPDDDYTVVAETPLYGPGRWALTAQGDPKARLAVFDVPAGYQAREAYVWTHDELDLVEQMGQVLYRAPTRVFDDPCNPEAPSRRLGPTVVDLTEALIAQKRTTTTRPVQVTLDGYDGFYIELSATAAHLESCGPEGGMALWKSGSDGERVVDFPLTDRYWILDVEGRRVVVTAMTPVGARAESVERVTDVAEAITFEEAPPV